MPAGGLPKQKRKSGVFEDPIQGVPPAASGRQAIREWMKTVLAITSVHRHVILEISLMARKLCALMRPCTNFKQRWYEKRRSAYFQGFSHRNCHGAGARATAQCLRVSDP